MSEFVTDIYDRLISKINERFNTIAKREKDIKIVEYIIQCIPMYIPIESDFIWIRHSNLANISTREFPWELTSADRDGISFDVYFSGGKSSINPLFHGEKIIGEIHIMMLHILLFNR